MDRSAHVIKQFRNSINAYIQFEELIAWLIMDYPEDSSPLAPFDAVPRNGSICSYIGKVMMGNVPKMLIILFCVVIAAYTTEITFPSTDSDEVASDICNYNPKGVASGPRVCHSLMGVAISSILVCMVLMIFDVFIPCVDTKFRRLAHGLSLLLSIIMGIMLLVTSSLMANLHARYCDYIEEHYYNDLSSDNCGKDEDHFLILPLFGYFTMSAWFRRLAHCLSLLLSIIMGIMLLVTSSLMANLYAKYCNYIEEYYYNDLSSYNYYSAKCGKDEKPFLILPIFGYFTMCAWGFNGLISLIRLVVNK